MENLLTEEERSWLLKIARQALQDALMGKPLLPMDFGDLPPRLCEPGATFVTLTRHGELRGCIGALEAYLPLVEDVREHAVAAGTQDYRFSPVQADELAEINIEISRLTPPVALPYNDPRDLPGLLRSYQDGVILRDGFQRATFLPQVWEKLPDPETFLTHLCHKMGAVPDLWRHKVLQVQIYQVEEFHE